MPTVYDAGPTLKQHCLVFSGMFSVSGEQCRGVERGVNPEL